MSTAQNSRLIAEISNLLNRPLGGAVQVVTDEVMQRRERLKQLRSQLESAQDPKIIKAIGQECHLLINQIVGSQEQPKNLQSDAPPKPDSDLNRLISTRRSLSPPARLSSPPEYSNIVNEILDYAMLGDDRQIANMRQTLRQAIEQTLAVERALTIADISGNIKNLVEAQRQAALSTELQKLDRQN